MRLSLYLKVTEGSCVLGNYLSLVLAKLPSRLEERGSYKAPVVYAKYCKF